MSDLVTVTLPRIFRYRIDGGDQVVSYPAGRCSIPAQMAANLLTAGAITRDSFATETEYKTADALRRPPEEPTPEATPAPASAPPAEAAQEPQEATPAPAESVALPLEIPGYGALRSAGIETLADLADYADDYTRIDGIGPVTADRIRHYLEA